MTSFIPYQPREKAPSFKDRTFYKSPTLAPPSWALSKQSLHYPGCARPRSKGNFVELVDLTASDHRDAIRREIPEPTVLDAAERRARFTGDGGSDWTDNDNEDDVEHGNDNDSEDGKKGGDDHDDHDIDYNGRAIDLSFLYDICAQSDKERMARRECCREGDCTDRANPTTSAASTVWIGTNQDNRIMLDDDEVADTHEVAVPNAETLSFEVAGFIDRCDPTPTFSGLLTEPGTKNGEKAENSLAQQPMDSRRDDKEKKGGDLCEDAVSHNDTVICCESRGDSMGLFAPASAGQVYDVFAEYERTFSTARPKHKTTRLASHDRTGSDLAASSVLQPTRLEEPRAVTDRASTNVGQPTEVTRNDIGPRKISEEVERGFTLQLRKESHRQKTQGARNRERARPSTGPTILPEDSAIRNRPYRITKKTWKAREACEELGVKRTQGSSGPY